MVADMSTNDCKPSERSGVVWSGPESPCGAPGPRGLTAPPLSAIIVGSVDRKILVVEDERGIADNISYALRTEGFAVDCCGTGREAESALAGGGVTQRLPRSGWQRVPSPCLPP